MASVVMRTVKAAADEGPAFLNAVERDLKWFVVQVGGEAARRAPVVMGSAGLRGSLQQTGVDRDGAVMRGYIGWPVYGKYVEWGTRPHMPPVDPILKWVENKKLATMVVAEKGGRAEFVVRRHTHKSVGRYASMATTANRMGTVRKESVVEKFHRAERSLAWAVALGIKKYGTKAQPHLRPAIADFWQALMDRLNRRYQGDFT